MFLTYDHTGDSLREQPVFLHAPRRWGHETRDETPGGGGGGLSSEFWIGVCREGS